MRRKLAPVLAIVVLVLLVGCDATPPGINMSANVIPTYSKELFVGNEVVIDINVEAIVPKPRQAKD